MRLGSAVALASLLCGGCASQPTRNTVNGEARRAITALVNDYESGQVEGFLERFDRNRFAQAEVFRERIRDFLLRNHAITIDAVIDTVLEKDGEVAVQLHWNRSFLNEAGAHALDSGRCEIIFRKQPSGGLTVTALRGAAPF